MSSNVQALPDRRVAFGPLFLALLGSFLIGTSPILVRLTTMGPFAVAFYRTSLSLPFTFLWMRWEKNSTTVPSTPISWKLVLSCGFFFAMDLAFWNYCVQYTTVANAALLNNIAAFIVPIISWALFRTKPHRMFVVWLLTAFVGACMLSGGGIGFSYGDTLAIISAVAVAAYLMIMKVLRETSKTGFTMFWTGVTASVFLGILAFTFEEKVFPTTWNDNVVIICQALFVHVAGQGLFAYCLGRLSERMSALVILSTPVSAAILGWILFAETMTLEQFVGAGVIMVSLVITRIYRLDEATT